jgi:hypothetical protein
MRYFASIVQLSCAGILLTASVAQAGFQFETPVPTYGSHDRQPGQSTATPAPVAPRTPLFAPPLQTSIESFAFDDNAFNNEGNLFAPVDATCAAGPEHVMNAGNAIIEWRTKDFLGAAPQVREALRDFFSPIPAPAPTPGVGTSLGTYGFNPRVLYDQYAGRFIVVMLEVWQTAAGKPSNQSRILLAISKTSDPNDGFWYHSINSKLTISGSDSFVDFPGIAVDDKAVYITGNMFSFAGLSYTGVRLWIVGKAAAYTDNDPTISVQVRNPYASAGFVTTTIPTQMFGPPPTGSGGRPMGTFLVAYSGITDGTDEYLQIVEVTDPLATAGGPFFTVQQLDVGDIDVPSLVLPDASQQGGGFPLETNDRRMLSAVWRANKLYCAANIRGASFTPDVNQCVARWWKLNTTNTTALSQLDAGNITGEDIAAGTHTYYPSVMVDIDGNMAVGFCASGTSLYAGAYYTTRLAGDPPGATSVPTALAAGQDFYRRYFGGTSNRWGNYNGIALSEPDEHDFWIFNQYAGPQGTIVGSDSGRWKTRLGRFRIKTVTGVAPRIPESTLLPNLPNPFNPSTTIRFTLAQSGLAKVVIYDSAGRHIRTLLDGVRAKGNHELVWDGRDDQGQPVASGIYLSRLRTGSTDQARKMVLIK